MRELTSGKVYKVWIDIEEYDIEGESGTMLDCLDIGCSGTFATEEEAEAFAKRMNAAFEKESDELSVSHV